MRWVKINEKVFVLIFGIIFFLSCWVLCDDVFAQERAIWVWSMADDIVLDEPAGSRAVFFSFCSAPHGDSSKAIKTIYLSGNVPGKDLVKNYPQQLRNFLADAHSRGFKVECLQGDKLWATPEYRADSERRCDEILDFNRAGSSDSERFDGIHYDVEPYLLRYSKGDSYDWDADNPTIWSQYLTLLSNCQSKVKNYNSSYTDIKFGVAIPWWYDSDGEKYPGTPKEVQERTDYITIMAYRDNGPAIVRAVASEIENGNSLKKLVYVGVETAQAVPPDPETITFYEEGNDYMEKQLSFVSEKLGGNSSFAGFAIHYYEDVDAGEMAYRKLWTDSFPGYHPIVKLDFPNGDEGIMFVPGVTYTIKWRSSDRDTKKTDLKIELSYSADSGKIWNVIATDETDDGRYDWDTTGLADGSNYQVKVIAKDPTNLIGFDTSDYDITFSSTPAELPDWSGGFNSKVNGVRPIIVPDGNKLHMVWYWPGWGNLPKGVYYRRSLDRGVSWGPTFTLAEDNNTEPRKPSFAVRGDVLAAVWIEGNHPDFGAQTVKVRISRDGGDTWGPAEEVQGDYSRYKWADFPDIAIDSGNFVHVVWGARNIQTLAWVLHYTSNRGGSWENKYVVVRSTFYLATPTIITAPNGVHIVFGFFRWWDRKYNIVSRSRYPSGWGLLRLVSKADGRNDVWTKYFPDICADDSKKLHVVWQDAGDNPQTDYPPTTSNIYYSASTDSGNSWSSRVYIGDGYAPSIATLGSEVRVIYYRPSSTKEKGEILYRKSTDRGKTWSPEAIITDDARMPYWHQDVPIMVGFPYLASDNSGEMVATWRGYTNERIMFSYRGLFGSPKRVHTDLVYGNSDSLKIMWRRPEEYLPNSYTLYRSVDGQTYTRVATKIYNISFIDGGLTSTSYYRYKVAPVVGDKEMRHSEESNVLYPGNEFLIDYFEGYEDVTYDKAGYSSLSWSFDTSTFHEGSRSIKIDYEYISGPDPTKQWGAVLIGRLPATIDITSYTGVRVWAKGGEVGKKGIAVQFFEVDRPEGGEVWGPKELPVVSNTDWQMYEFQFKDFQRTTLGNNNFDKRDIGGYQIFFSKDTPDGSYWVDKIELFREPPSLEVELAPEDADKGFVDFGRFQARFQDRRKQSNAITIIYSGFKPPWTIRVWTNNSPGGGPEPWKAGLKRSDGVIYLPLKIWCANYGPLKFDVKNLTRGPDEENEYFWRGYDFNNDGDREDMITSGKFVEKDYGFDIDGDGDLDDTIEPTLAKPLSEEPVWLRVPEKDEMDPGNIYTWRRLTWNDGLGDNAELGGKFKVFLAIDVSRITTKGNPPTDYSTVMTVEYLNE